MLPFLNNVTAVDDWDGAEEFPCLVGNQNFLRCH